MADFSSTVSQIIEGSNAVRAINELFDAASPSMVFGRDAAGCSGLVWAWLGGRWGGNLIGSGNITLSPNSTYYMVVQKSNGEVSFDTSLYDWINETSFCTAYVITTGTTTVSNYEDWRAGPGGTQYGTGLGGGSGAVDTIVAGPGIEVDSTDPSNPEVSAKAQAIIVACGDESTALTTGTAKVTFRMPFAGVLEGVRASVNTSPTGSTLVVDINEAGSSVLSTKLSIDASEKTSTTAATPAVISDSSLADDAEITIDIDQVGSSVAGAGLKVVLIVRRA